MSQNETEQMEMVDPDDIKLKKKITPCTFKCSIPYVRARMKLEQMEMVDPDDNKLIILFIFGSLSISSTCSNTPIWVVSYYFCFS